MNEVGAVPPLEFHDRKTGLIVFGILLILLGCGAGMLVPLMMLGVLLPVPAGMEPTPIRLILPGLFVYLVLAVAFIWLGIGSLFSRRWARALVLIIAWYWLLSGVMLLPCTALMMPQLLAHTRPGVPQLPPEMQTIITWISLSIDFVIFILIPGVLVLFFGSRHVKATCEARDPVARWTDACPLPVLAVSFLLGISAASIPVMTLCTNSVVPFFGGYLSGVAGMAVLLIAAAVSGFIAHAFYKLKVMGWWVALIYFALWAMSYTITLARVGIIPMYELMGLPPGQLANLKQVEFLQGFYLWIFSTICTVPYLGFLLFTKRYFKKETNNHFNT